MSNSIDPCSFFFKTQLFTPSNETKSKLWKNKKTKSNPKCSLHSSQLCAMNGVEKKRKEKVVLWMRINLTCYCGLMKRKKVGLKGLICLTVGFFREMIWKVARYWRLHSNTPNGDQPGEYNRTRSFVSSVFYFYVFQNYLTAPSSHERSFFNDISHKRSFLFLHKT